MFISFKALNQMQYPVPLVLHSFFHTFWLSTAYLCDLEYRQKSRFCSRTMLDELHGPLVIHVAEEATNVRTEHPVQLLPLDADRSQRAQVLRLRRS